MKISLSLILWLFSGPLLFAQKKAPAPLKVVSSFAVYKNSCRQNPDKQLIELKKAIPDLQLDIRYATKNNFMKQIMYPQARAFARKPVVQQLQKVQDELRKKGLGLRIYDAYRPYAITVAFYQKASDKHFVANPTKGSRHNRGCAIDLSLINLKTGKELPMPTPYDSFAPQAAADYAELPVSVIRNRNLLIRTMQAHGFRVLKNEWWHYDFVGWQNYELLDIPFKDL
ncbi:M15 family metallopeptidase [Pedobacter sp.]|jgi:D-alanyl-D-alanine dipeptidase|uniref:M15 family metallopeptidase n=1 Tax=Pedobacter sp. TaxID=1411316 RepID=UPI002CA68353|nr:M15 family metallopeptidase [Pedobacter sp.]HWW43045.1 M15 family metallopeptidase [Pedobacter sp.]